MKGSQSQPSNKPDKSVEIRQIGLYVNNSLSKTAVTNLKSTIIPTTDKTMNIWLDNIISSHVAVISWNLHICVTSPRLPNKVNDGRDNGA